MKQPKFAVDETVERFCGVCDTEKDHTVTSVTKQGKITELSCAECATVSQFSRDVKTSVKMSKAKAGMPYDRTQKYKKGQALMHHTFGQGEITALIEPNKMDVLFGDRTRRLIHSQN